jgi:hypothetical protein
MSEWLHTALQGWQPNIPAALLFAILAALLVLIGRKAPDRDDAP